MIVLEEARRVDRYGIVHDDDMSFESFEEQEKGNNNKKKEERCREDPDEDQGGLYAFLCAGDSICNPWDHAIWNRKEEATDDEISKDSTRDGKSDHDELYRDNEEEPVMFYPKKTNENNIRRNNKGLKGKVRNILKEGSFRWRKGKRVGSTNNKNQERKKGGSRKKKKKTQAEF